MKNKTDRKNFINVVKRLIPSVIVLIFVFSLLCSCAALTSASDYEEEPKNTQEQYDLDYIVTFPNIQAGYEISPFIYGEFLEHIPGCIYGTIWAELIEDRKFYYPMGEEGLSPWKTSGDVKCSDDCYSLNGYAALLGENAAISQKVDLTEQKYVGYFYAKGDGKVEVKAGEIVKNVDVGGGYAKYSFEIDVRTSGEEIVSFRCVSGEVKIDSLSLMPSDNYNGMRIDTLNALKELSGTIYRWPGGNFVSGYNWKDGIGDRDKRVCLRNSAWFPDNGDIEEDKLRLASGMGFYARIEPNDMGTDEFLSMCEYIGATPYIAVNTGSGTVRDAVDYVDYCNGSAGTEYGALRIANGHSAPYNVKYWCIGNEMQGDWQIGHMPIENYTQVHNNFVDAMRSADPEIIVTGCGDNFSDWTDGMFAACAERLDYIGEHLYVDRKEDFSPQALINTALNNFEYRINSHRALLKKYPLAANVKIAFDEYAYAWNGHPTMKDAMGLSAILNLFIQNADVVGMANYSDAVFVNTKTNGPGAIYTYQDYVEFSAIGRVLQMYAKNMQSYSLSFAIRQTDKTTGLQYQATIDKDCKTISLAVTNPSEKTIKLSVKGLNHNAEKHVSVVGTGENMENGLTERVNVTEVQRPDALIMKPFSVNIFVFNLE